MKIRALVIALLIAGCASRSGVAQIGDGVFQTSAQATWERGGLVGAHRMTLEDATAHCKAQGKTVRMLDSREGYEHFSGGTVTLRFGCDPPR